MKIGELAQQTGASIRSLRYYDETGLLTATRRSNGYRLFTAEAVAQVKQIRALLAVGFSIADIHLLLPCLRQQKTGSPLCETAIEHYRQKLAALHEQIQVLEGLSQRIEERLQLALKSKQ